MRQLSNLVKAYPAQLSGDGTIELSGLTSDSRAVEPGFLFAAIPGVQINGEKFISNAIEAGAVAVLISSDSDVTLPDGVMRVAVDNPRLALAQYAAAFYQPQPEHVVAITGTDGKTSTAEFTRQLWDALGRKSASVGTLGVTCEHCSNVVQFPNTTPDPVVLHHAFSDLAKAGVEHIAVEASSHGLDQARLDGVHPKVGAFTTFGHDHGDYHHTVERYFDAKMRLFRELMLPGGVAVLNADDLTISVVADELKSRGIDVVTFGKSGREYRIVSSLPVADGLHVKLEILGVPWEGNIPLYGQFQLMNILTAMALIASVEGWTEIGKHDAEITQLITAVSSLKGVAGRLEPITKHSTGAPIFTDYAHTPDALGKVLQSLRPHTDGNLHVVFGCGGDRDTAKRPLMGKVAAELADFVIVTDDNPRSEVPELIRKEIIAAAPDAIEIGDRVQAIKTAISNLKQGDVLLVAGKGHEDYQIVGDERLHHHDGETILSIVNDVSQKDAS